MKEKIEIIDSTGEKLVLSSDNFDRKVWPILKEAVSGKANILFKKADDSYEILEENRSKFEEVFSRKLDGEAQILIKDIIRFITDQIDLFFDLEYFERFFSDYIYNDIKYDIPENKYVSYDNIYDIIGNFFLENKEEYIALMKNDLKNFIYNLNL